MNVYTRLFLFITINSLGALLFWFFGESLWGIPIGFVAFAVFQYIITHLYNQLFVIRKNEEIVQKAEKIVNEFQTALSNAKDRVVVGLRCAVCREENRVSVTFHDQTRFRCQKCNAPNGVQLQFLTTLINVPVNEEDVTQKLSQTAQTQENIIDEQV